MNRVAIIGIIFIAIIIMIVTLSTNQINKNRSPIPISSPQQTLQPGETIVPTTQPSSIPQEQEAFQVLSTSPSEGTQNLYTGEQELVVTTDKSILSPSSYRLEITPALPYYWKDQTDYPSAQLKYLIVGGLRINTRYTVILKDISGQTVYQWSFTSGAQRAESSSELVKDQALEHSKKVTPLFEWTPYYSNDFDLDYSDVLTLSVYIKNPDVEGTKKKVEDWIRSHEIEPSSHKINYTVKF